MYHLTKLKTMTPRRRDSIGAAVPGLLTVLVCFALSPAAQAVTPAPDGFYPGSNTAEGENALFSLTTGEFNTAIGAFALYSNTTGFDNTAIGSRALVLTKTRGASDNTAIGSGALASNTNGNFNTATGSQALVSANASGNTANGGKALFSDIKGGENCTALPGISSAYFMSCATCRIASG